jgi:hypothetical protein
MNTDNFSLYAITDNGMTLISKHVSSLAAMIQSSVHAEHESGEWEYFQSPIHETWVSETFCIIKEAGE